MRESLGFPLSETNKNILHTRNGSRDTNWLNEEFHLKKGDRRQQTLKKIKGKNNNRTDEKLNLFCGVLWLVRVNELKILWDNKRSLYLKPNPCQHWSSFELQSKSGFFSSTSAVLLFLIKIILTQTKSSVMAPEIS